MTAELIPIPADPGPVSGLLLLRPEAAVLLVLAHGAGAGMRHPFLEQLAESLAARRVATLRFQFPFAERGSRRPDPPPIAQATVRAALAVAGERCPDLPVLAGGKSFGGRMTSGAAVEGGLPGAKGLVFLGFPLHASGRPGTARATHLERVALPMLFLQGTRDALADIPLMRELCGRLGARAALHVLDGADHMFRVPRRSGRTDAEVLEEIAGVVAAWGKARVGAGP